MRYYDFYRKITEPLVLHYDKRLAFLKCEKVLTGSMYIAYPVLLVILFLFHSDRLVNAIVVPAVGLLLVTIVRKLLNRARPYEAEGIVNIMPKERQGCSMPSRHVFSSAVIAMAWFTVSPVLGWIFLVVTILNAFARVIGGVHYPSDVIVGMVLGVLSGLLI